VHNSEAQLVVVLVGFDHRGNDYIYRVINASTLRSTKVCVDQFLSRFDLVFVRISWQFFIFYVAWSHHQNIGAGNGSRLPIVATGTSYFTPRAFFFISTMS
jgi:hypothetical protein